MIYVLIILLVSFAYVSAVVECNCRVDIYWCYYPHTFKRCSGLQYAVYKQYIYYFHKNKHRPIIFCARVSYHRSKLLPFCYSPSPKILTEIF